MGLFKHSRFKYSGFWIKMVHGLKRVLFFLLVSLILSVGYYVIFVNVFSSPAEKALKNENKLLKQEYKNMSEKLTELNGVLDALEVKDEAIYGALLQGRPAKLQREADYSKLLSTPADSIAKFVPDIMEKIGTLEKKVVEVSAKLKDLDSLFRANSGFENVPSMLPVKAEPIKVAGASVGKKVHPFYKKPVMHTGLDLLIGSGTDVYATAYGVVDKVERSRKGSGNTVRIQHEGGYVTVYSHLSDIFVHRGMYVKRGTKIGKVGNTGVSFVPHLHYEVTVDGNMADPVNFLFCSLSPQEYEQVVALTYNNGQSFD